MAIRQTPFNTDHAINMVHLIQVAYSQYSGALPVLPFVYGDYTILEYIFFTDFVSETRGAAGVKAPYGFIAQSTLDPSEFTVALRGTEGYVEWYDDLHLKLDPYFIGKGETEMGFTRIYDSGRVDVIATINKWLATVDSPKLYVTGHSLGAGLATILAFDLANDPATVPSDLHVYTFASPMVGDKLFAANYDVLIPQTWRVANQLDVITWLPSSLMGYHHVDTEQELTFGLTVKPTPICRHALTTYLYGLDSSLGIPADCAWF